MPFLGTTFPTLDVYVALGSGVSSIGAVSAVMVGLSRCLLAGATYHSFTVVERVCSEGRTAHVAYPQCWHGRERETESAKCNEYRALPWFGLAQGLPLILTKLTDGQVPFIRYISNLAQVYRGNGRRGGRRYRVFRVLCSQSSLKHGTVVGWMCRRHEARKHKQRPRQRKPCTR